MDAAVKKRATDTLHPNLMTSGPLYKQVKAMILDSLSRNEWNLGERIPTEPVLAARYGVGVSTIRAALAELVQSQLLVRKQGKGTFVAIPDRHSYLYQFFRITPKNGPKHTPTTELISFRKSRADAKAAEALQLDAQRDSFVVYELKNVIRLAGVPVAMSDFVIPETLFPGLTKQKFLEAAQTPFGVYQTEYGINIVRTVERLRAVKADAVAAKVFKIRRGEPLLQVDRIAYTFNDVPVEVRKSLVETTDHCYLFQEGGTS